MIDGVDVAALIAKIPLPGSSGKPCAPSAPTISGFTASTSRPPPTFAPTTSHVRSSSSTSDPRRSPEHEPNEHSSRAVRYDLHGPTLGSRTVNVNSSPRLRDPERERTSGHHAADTDNVVRLDTRDPHALGEQRLSAENVNYMDSHSQNVPSNRQCNARNLLRKGSHSQHISDEHRVEADNGLRRDPGSQPHVRHEEARMVVSIDGQMHDWNQKTKSAHGVDINYSLDAEQNSNGDARHADAPESFLLENERQQILACLEDREWHVAWLEEALCSQSEEFSQSIDERASELQASKEREIILHARAEASSRELSALRDELTEAVKLQKERYVEVENLHQQRQQLRSELSGCEDRNAALELANQANAEVQRELGALKDAIAAKDRTIAKFEEEKRHRPLRHNDKYMHVPDPRLEKVVPIEEFTAAQSEAAKLREQVADMEKMRNQEIMSRDGNLSSGLNDSDGLALKKEVDSLRAELFAASASERDAQQLACSVLSELKEARLAQDELNSTAISQQLAANSEDTFRAHIANLERHIATLDATVAERDRDVGDITEINNTLNETNATLRQKLALAEERNQQLTDTLADTKTDLVSQHAAKLDALRRVADSDKNAALDTLQAQMARLEEDISAQVERRANERMRALEVAHKEACKRAQEEADELRAQLKAEEAKVKIGQADLRTLHQEKAQMGVARRDLELKMEAKMDDLRLQVKMRDLEKMKLSEDREQELHDLRRDLEVLRRKQVDQKESKLLEGQKRENRALVEKVSNLEREKDKIEQLRQHFAQEAAALRKVLQEESESKAENEELRKTIKNLEKARNVDVQENRDINSLRQRIRQLEKKQQRSVSSSTRNVALRMRCEENYDDDVSPQPRIRTDRGSPLRWRSSSSERGFSYSIDRDAGSRDVRRSADSYTRRADKNRELDVRRSADSYTRRADKNREPDVRRSADSYTRRADKNMEADVRRSADSYTRRADKNMEPDVRRSADSYTRRADRYMEPDVRRSADSYTRRADKNMESETQLRQQRASHRQEKSDLRTSVKGRTYRSKAKLLGLLSDSDSSLERMVIESDPFRRG